MNKFTKSAVLATSVLALAACGGGGGDAGEAGIGTLRLALTDAPACGLANVWVTVDRVRVHRSIDADPADPAGWFDIVLPQPRRIDLLALTNGALEELGQTALPAGRYNQLRLVLAPNDGAGVIENAVRPVGGSEVALDAPSGWQSGLKMNADIAIEAGRVADFVIDFDACRSVVERGNSGRYNLKPVLEVIPRGAPAGARIIGYVAPELADATVSVQSGGVPLRSTIPDTNGRFELYPVPVGTHAVVIAGGGHVTGVITGVPVTADAFTFVNATSAPLTLPAATLRRVRGSVAVAATLAPQAVIARATQELADGTLVEAGAVPVDTGSGAFELALPIDAPRVAAYVAQAPAPVFAAQASAAARYRVEVVLRQTPPLPALRQSQAVDLGLAVPDPLPLEAFVFP